MEQEMSRVSKRFRRSPFAPDKSAFQLPLPVPGRVTEVRLNVKTEEKHIVRSNAANGVEQFLEGVDIGMLNDDVTDHDFDCVHNLGPGRGVNTIEKASAIQQAFLTRAVLEGCPIMQDVVGNNALPRLHTEAQDGAAFIIE